MENSTDHQPEQKFHVNSELVKSIQYNAKTYRLGIIIGQSIGAFVFLIGFILFVLGLSEKIEWIVQAGEINSRILNASPGGLCIITGLLLLLRYKPILMDRLAINPGEQQTSSMEEMLNEDEVLDKKPKFDPFVKSKASFSRGDSTEYHGEK